jgi:hypothetical protein
MKLLLLLRRPDGVVVVVNNGTFEFSVGLLFKIL